MSDIRFSLRSAVYVMLIRDRKILLLRRFNTGWKDGFYSLPAGHLDGKETVTDATIREAKEEAGISIQKEDVHVVHTMHRDSGDREYIDFFLAAASWKGDPKIAEPDKCDDLSWFPIDQLPSNTIESVRAAINYYHKGVTFSEFGWQAQ